MAVQWDEMSAADYDARLVAKGHKRAPADQAALFYVPAPVKARKADQSEELPGQGDLFEMFPETA